MATCRACRGDADEFVDIAEVRSGGRLVSRDASERPEGGSGRSFLTMQKRVQNIAYSTRTRVGAQRRETRGMCPLVYLSLRVMSVVPLFASPRLTK